MQLSCLFLDLLLRKSTIHPLQATAGLEKGTNKNDNCQGDAHTERTCAADKVYQTGIGVVRTEEDDA